MSKTKKANSVILSLICWEILQIIESNCCICPLLGWIHLWKKLLLLWCLLFFFWKGWVRIWEKKRAQGKKVHKICVFSFGICIRLLPGAFKTCLSISREGLQNDLHTAEKLKKESRQPKPRPHLLFNEDYCSFYSLFTPISLSSHTNTKSYFLFLLIF